MKKKKLTALLMAACMLVSTPVMASAEIPAETAESEVVEETAFEAQTETTESAEPSQNEPQNTEVFSTEQAQTNGVIPPEDAAPVENKSEAGEQHTENSELVELGKYSIEEVDRETIEVDLNNSGTDTAFGLLNEETVSDEDIVNVIILMDEQSIIEKNSNAKLNWLTKIQIAVMESKQKSVISKIERSALDGGEMEVRYQYTWLLNGVATKVPYGTIEDIKAVAGVKDVLLETVYNTCDTTVDPYTVADGVMIGREDTWASGYTGKGIKISVIDTGLDADHQNFAALPEEKLTSDSATKETVSSVLDSLNASKIWSQYAGETLTIGDVYYSTKVAYGFNYVDANLTIDHSADTQGDHGTHVAGISAANDLENGEAVGVAPDAQLYVMKVFGANGGAYSSDLLAAVEDSLLLGADVINMSLGSPAGFTSDGEMFDEIYGRVDDTNTILAVAAGNSTTAGAGNLWGTDTNLTSNPDNSIISSPATYVNATSVASVENVGVKSDYLEINGTKMAYDDGSNGANAPFLNLGGASYDYAMVGNCGQTLEDFTAADVAGKIAVVQRGVTAFGEKHQLAQEAGAIACLVYNNVSGSFGMDLSSGNGTIPCASITIASGELLAYAKQQNADAVLFVSSDKAIVANDAAYQMSDFSSWGASPNLKLEPDVTAPGGNIYSTLDGGQYGVMSGTSMASPNMAGVSALVMQYAKENYPELSAAELHTFVNRLIVSTADPLAYDENTDYSPRNQGAGLVNAYNAVNTGAYLNVAGSDVAKAELGDDAAKTGVYSYDFEVVNFGKETLYYNLETSSQTEGVLDYGIYFMSTTPVALSAVTKESSANMVGAYDYNADQKLDSVDARQFYLALKKGSEIETTGAYNYDLDGNEAVEIADVQAYLDVLVGKNANEIDLTEQTLVVKAGETANVTVSVSVTEEGKEYMDTYFENGIYVEGFTKLTARNAGVDLSLPYLAFYGDWTKAPILDSGYYWEDEEEVVANQYYNVIFTNYGSSSWNPGVNPYLDEAFDRSNISVSPNGDGYADYFDDIYVSLLRNAATLSFTYTDAETGEVYFEEVLENITKSYYVSSYGMVLPYVYSWYSEPYLFTDKEGNTLSDGTKLTLSIKATLDYDAHESNNVSDEWIIPITIDTKTPQLLDAVAYQDEATGRYFMEVTVKDDVAVAAVNILNKSGTAILAQEAVDKAAQGEAVKMTYDITGYGEELTIVLGDYAFNESSYVLKIKGNAPEVDETLLYGYRVYDENYTDDRRYGWVGIDSKTAETKVCSSEYYVDYALIAATQAGGKIIAVDANDDLVAITPGYWDERTKIASLGTTVNQLAFDPTSKTLYGYDKDNYALVTLDIVTGEVTPITTGYYLTNVITMACTDDGVLYALDNFGNLSIINKETGEWGEMVLETGSVLADTHPVYHQSMTYDKDTNSLYWARYAFGMNYEGKLYQIDLANAYTIKEVGVIAGNAEIVGLLTLDDKGYTLPEVSLESISLDKEKVTLLPGQATVVNVLKTPWYAESEEYVWTSSDESVATVENGTITAYSAGNAEIQVKTADGNYHASCSVKVVAPASDLTAFSIGGETTYNQWISFNASKATEMNALTEGDFISFYAGEYLDGYIYAYSSAAELYKIDAKTFEKTQISASRTDGYMGDMAFDYSTGYMYGLFMDFYGGTNFVAIDILTGDFEVIAYNLLNEYGNSFISLAVSTDGTIYLMSMEGLLYTFDAETLALTKIGYTGYSASITTQCMAYDHNTKELYWSMVSSAAEFALMYVDTATGTALPLRTVDNGAQMVAMYVVPEQVMERPEVAVTEVTAKEEKVILLQGAALVPPVEVKPYNATNRTLEWTSSDESIAVVADGKIVGKAAGTAVLTGTLGEFQISIEAKVVASTGALTGYVLSDLSSGAGQIWGEFYDYDLSSGNGIADADCQIYAGEYYNGKIYGYGPDLNTWEYTYYVIDAKTYKTEQAIACQADAPSVVEMAFDYSTGTMYAVAGAKNTNGNNTLYMIDIKDGSFYKVGDFTTRVMTLACTEAGVMYGVDESGVLYQIEKGTAALTEIGYTGYSANQYQSMAYDYDTGNMYWAQTNYDWSTWSMTAAFLLVDVTDASVVNLGQIGTAGCEITALHSVPEKELTVQTPQITGVILDKTSEMVTVGESFKLTAKTAPISVVEAGAAISYESDNTAVVTVSADGTVAAVGVGQAVITASCGEISASCIVDVLGEETKIYAVNANGWETAPLLQPMTILESVSIPAEAGLTIAKACYSQDGYFYAVDENGDLWKYTEDLVQLEKVGNVLTQLSNAADVLADDITASLLDLEANAFNGKIYALVRFSSIWSERSFIYEINPATAEATAVTLVSYEVGRAADIAFMSEEEVLVYDSLYDYIYSGNLETMDVQVSQLAFLQATVESGSHLSMTYSKELNQIFIATDDATNNSGVMALYRVNPANGIITKISNAKYNAGLASIILVEGTEPVVGAALAANTAEETTEAAESTETTESTEAAEDTETVEETETTEDTEVVEETEITEDTEVVEETETTEDTEAGEETKTTEE